MGSGILIGVAGTISAVVLIAAAVICICLSKGYIKIGLDGSIYVQNEAVNDSAGIGSDVENKLNALDAVLDNFYFGDVDKEKAKDAIYKSYLASYGDVYTVYYTPEEYKSIMESTSGKFCGIGAVCQKSEEGGILVVDPYEDAPAYKAGVRKGDRIVKVDGNDVSSMDLSPAVALIKGDEGSTVELEIVRNGQTMTFKVIRAVVDIKTVEYEMLEDNIGYIQVSQFDDVTTKQFKTALTALREDGMKGLVIDIRSNPGGVLDVVVDMVDEIISTGTVVYTEDKEGNQRRYNADNTGEFDLPLAVLVNGDSASASEIFAGAIQDYDKGEIIGTKTFGKGIVQTIQPLSDGSAIKYTISKYFTGKGQDVHGNGITPDQIVELPDDAQTDLQLEAAVKYIKSKFNN